MHYPYYHLIDKKAWLPWLVGGGALAQANRRLSRGLRSYLLVSSGFSSSLPER